jgi:L-fuculose-phosphate aldolase
VAAALELAVEVESLARIYLLACQAGRPARLSDAEMDRVLERYRHYGAPRPRGR